MQHQRNRTNRLAELRQASDLSRADVAEHARVTEQTVAAWERDGIPTEAVPQLAALFRVKASWLAGEPLQRRARLTPAVGLVPAPLSRTRSSCQSPGSRVKGLVLEAVESSGRPDESSLTAADIAAIETGVLARAVTDVSEWISELPDASEWALALRRIRAQLVDDLALRAGSLPQPVGRA